MTVFLRHRRRCSGVSKYVIVISHICIDPSPRPTNNFVLDFRGAVNVVGAIVVGEENTMQQVRVLNIRGRDVPSVSNDWNPAAVAAVVAAGESYGDDTCAQFLSSSPMIFHKSMVASLFAVANGAGSRLHVTTVK